MPFCHNCGVKVAIEDAYCQECGTALHNDLDFPKSNDKLDYKPANDWGYIFTNIESLCSNLNVSAHDVISVITTYIDARSQQGVNYELIDASNYTFHSNSLTVALSADDSWLKYQEIVIDSYNYDTTVLDRKVKYIFIIGGNNIIPMPKVGDLTRLEGDSIISEKIDSDLPYGALYGEQTDQMLIDMSICQVPHMLFVGRLPMGKDTSLGSLSATFKRMATVGERGLHIKEFYGQSDPHWKEASAEVAGDFANQYSTINSNNYYYKNISLTPYIVSNQTYDRFRYEQQLISPLRKHFNDRANLYYFNMHGSNAPQSSGFYGAGATGEMFEGVTPNDMASLQELNVVVTEACYGARFINKSTAQSMMLSAFEQNTVIYVGSSRIAYGNSCGMSSADLIAHHFMNKLCEGYTAGAAMHLTRKALIECEGIHSEYSQITMAEFNLFGDPTLAIVKPLAPYLTILNETNEIDPRVIIYTNADSRIKRMKQEIVYNATKTSKTSNLRDIVENLVNRSIIRNHHLITQHLYSYYNLSPRPLSFVVKSSMDGDAVSYSYHYRNDNNEFVVILDTNDNIQKILTSKND